MRSPRSRASWICSVTFLTALGLPFGVWAIDGTPGDDALAERLRPRQSFHDHQRLTPGLQRLLNRRSPALLALERSTGTDWWALWNEGTRHARLALVGAAPVRAGSVPEAELPGLAFEVLGESRDLHGVDPETLVLDRVRTVQSLRIVQFRQHLAGLPVEPSLVGVTFCQRPDGLALTRIDAEACLDAPQLDLELTPDEATALARSWIGRLRIEEISPATQIVAPAIRADGKGLEGHPAYRFRITARQPFARYEVVVDALDGSILSAEDHVRHLDVAGTVQGFGSPGGLPDIPSNPPAALPIAGLTVLVTGVGSAVTDAAGSFQFTHPGVAPVPLALQLAGPHVNVNNEAGIDLSLGTTAVPGTPLVITLNDPPDPLVTAQINGFIHTNVVHGYHKDIDPTWNDLDFPLPCNVNVSNTCNAYYDGNSINFFLAGNGCANSCYSSVVYHEYGHAVLDQIVPFADGNYHEGFADVTSTLLTDDPNIGAGFSSGSFLRNVDVQDRSYPQDVNNPVHDAGLIVGGSFWDTRTALGASLGSAAGLAVARDLYLQHTAFQTGEISPVLTIDVLTVDDDDGNLLNGTPHYGEIAQGFGLHGLDAPDLVYATFVHAPLPDTVNDQLDHVVTVEAVGTLSPIATVELAYRSGISGPFTFVPMTASGQPDTYAASFPAPPSPERVEYYLQATDADGNQQPFPEGAPQETFGYFVGQVTVLLDEPVGATDNGWTHAQIAQQDDWQRGPPNQQAPQFVNQWDPMAAHSPPHAWGNDLAPPPNWNGNYQNNVNNYLESPPIDCSGQTGIWLEYRRWLTVEKAQYDQAQVRVNGSLVFGNAFAVDHVDSSWVGARHDISAIADGQPDVRIRFSLVSDAGLTFGGWNIDDLRVVAVTESNPDIHSLILPAASIPAGSQAPILVRGRNDLLANGYTVAASYDPQQLSVLEVTLAGTDVETLNPDFFAPQQAPGFFGADVVQDLFGFDHIPPAGDRSLLVVRLGVAAGATPGTVLPLTLVDGNGSPPLTNGWLSPAGLLQPTILESGSVAVEPFTGTPFVRGDASGDGTVNLPDVILTLGYLFTQGSVACLDAIDFDDDGTLDLVDPVSLLGYLFQSGPPPAPPFPQPGSDPTPDALPDC